MSKRYGSLQGIKSESCVNCGSRITKHSGYFRYCSMACRVEHQRAMSTHVCKRCGVSFYRPPGHVRRLKSGAFCSAACFQAWQTGENNAVWVDRVKKVCVICGAVSEFPPSLAKKMSTCGSDECKRERIRRMNSKEKVEVICEVCGKSMKLSPSWARDKRFCSKTCKAAAHSVEVSGSGNGRYVHGEHRRPYGSGWTKTLKKRVSDRDGGACRVCGRTEIDNGKKLCIHHIDYDKDNMSEGNLITLCKWCHGRMHGKVEERMKWKSALLSLLDGSREKIEFIMSE
jgi:hypothetical protein